MNKKIVLAVQNLDMAGLLERLDRVRFEVLKANSSNFDQIMKADRERMNSYLAELQSYANYFAEEPEQDFPESYPDMYTVRYLVTPEILKVENMGIRDLDRLLEKIIVEMGNSQTARYPAGWHSPDKTRFDKYILRVKSLLEKHLDGVNPMDLPETNPSDPSITDGYLGTNP